MGRDNFVVTNVKHNAADLLYWFPGALDVSEDLPELKDFLDGSLYVELLKGQLYVRRGDYGETFLVSDPPTDLAARALRCGIRQKNAEFEEHRKHFRSLEEHHESNQAYCLKRFAEESVESVLVS